MALVLAAGDPYVVVNKNGVIVRSEVSKASALVCELACGTVVAVDAYAKDEAGTVRLRLASPAAGWTSAKLLRPLSVVESVAARRSDGPLVVLYAVNAKVGAKWYYGFLRDVLLRDVDHIFVPVGDDFFGEAGRRRAAWLPANDEDKVAARAGLLAGAARVLVVWNDFEHDRSVVERFVESAPCPVGLFHVGDERTSDALDKWEKGWPEALKRDFDALEAEDPAALKTRDLIRLYGKCACVLRCYLDAAYAGLPHVLAVPLGYKTGFAARDGDDAAPAPPRPHAWAFAGQATKSSRVAMMANLAALRGTRATHVFDDLDWDAPTNLDTGRYRDLMRSADLAPCPVGWIHPDSFRLYEALECGAVPVVERPDYFRALLGAALADACLHATRAWDGADVAALQAALDDRQGFEARRARCAGAWKRKKADLARDVARHLETHLK